MAEPSRGAQPFESSPDNFSHCDEWQSLGGGRDGAIGPGARACTRVSGPLVSTERLSMHKGQSGAVAQRMVHLGTLLREQRGEIVDRWVNAVRLARRAHTTTAPALLDHLPRLLDDIATLADEVAHRGATSVPGHDAVAPARHRFEAGFDLEAVIREYAELRTTILEILDTGARALYPGELTLVNRALDGAIGQAVSAYATAQQRVPRALDRVSEAALSATDPEEMLSRLLDVFIEVAAPADTVTLLLREGDVFRVRASVGLH